MSSIYKSITGPIRWWGQSPHEAGAAPKPREMSLHLSESPISLSF
jgi:hypothetical protein